LWAGWAARAGRLPDPEALGRAAAMARTVETAALRPLRSARRALDRADPARSVVAAAELDVERRLLEGLEAMLPIAGRTPGVRAGLEAAAQAWGGGLSTERLAALADAFSQP